MRTAFTALLAAFMLTAPAVADTFIVQGNFASVGDPIYPSSIPANTLSGTIDITNGVITAAEFIVPGLSPVTNIESNEYFRGEWYLAVTNTNGDDVGLFFTIFPDIYPPSPLRDFLKGNLAGGFAANTSGPIITYYGLALTGTICPIDGCASVPAVPGPVLGAGLPGLMLAGLFIWWRREVSATIATTTKNI